MARRWHIPPWRIPCPLPAGWLLSLVLGDEWALPPDELRRTAPFRWMERWAAWQETLTGPSGPPPRALPDSPERLIGL